MRDEQLLKRLKSGDYQALDEIVESYTRLVWNVAGSILKNAASREDIEECVADVFVLLWRRPEKFKPSRGTLKTYLALLARSCALNRFRALSGSAAVPLEETACPAEDVLLGLVRREESSLLFSALDALREPDREIFYRRHVLGQKPNAIARCMGLEKREISNRLYRSRGRMKTILQTLEVET